MHDDRPSRPPLPEHPELREIALAMEGAGVSGELMDANWRSCSSRRRRRGSSECPRRRWRGSTASPSSCGTSTTPTTGGSRRRSVAAGGASNVPIMRHYLAPGDPIFDEVFAPLAENAGPRRSGRGPPSRLAAQLRVPPRAAAAADRARRHHVPGPAHRRSRGTFIGVLRLVRAAMPDSLLARLGRATAGCSSAWTACASPPAGPRRSCSPTSTARARSRAGSPRAATSTSSATSPT